MHGKWAIDFSVTKVAMLITYSHHYREFLEYKKSIVSQFTTFIGLSQHSHIIILNCAICLHVAHLNDLFLDKYDQFGDLITHHVIIGVNTALG